MKHLKVSTKLIFSFTIVIVAAITVGLVGILGMNTINKADDSLYNENVVALSAMGSIREILQSQIVQMRNLALNAGRPEKLQEILETLALLEKDMDDHFIEYEGTITDYSAEEAYLEGKAVYLNEFSGVKKRITEASFESLEAAYNIIYDPHVAGLRATMIKDFAVSMDQNDDWAREKVDENTGLFKTMMLIEIALLALAVIIAVYLALRISSLISKPLLALTAFMKKAGTTGDITLDSNDVEVITKFSKVRDEIGQTISGAASFISHVTSISKDLETVAGGDLTVDIKLLSDADTMGTSLKKTIASLNDMFAEIKSSTSQVSAGAKQVADGAQSLAQGATEQASSIQQLSNSVAEVAEMTKKNAKTAEQTSQLSDAIKEDAEKGRRQMEAMTAAVGEINEASKKISNIIKTIDDIAFQTNILALNAAVEAARAGQHGKGFAVVAEEVRNLASKSAEAAKDTGGMIQNSMDKAQLGSRIAGETAMSINEIVSGISESSRLIADIAKASEEQARSISQINTGIDQVAQVVQQNSATAEESAAASEEMSGQSDVLQQLITQFKLKDSAETYRSLLQAEKVQRRRLSIPDRAGPPPPSSGSGFGKY